MTEPLPNSAPARSVAREKIGGRYCVVIPAFNAQATVGKLVGRIREIGFDVAVVDDGSEDKTAELASKAGAVVISHLRNRGKGQALRTGFEYARKQGYDGVVTLDSDGQHDPEEIALLVRAGETQHAGIVLGDRMSDGALMPLVRWKTNRVMSLIVSKVARQPIADSQCGFRMIRREVLESVPIRAQRFEIETELLLNAARQRWKIISVPIKTIYGKDHQSHIKPLRDGARFFSLILKHLASPR